MFGISIRSVLIISSFLVSLSSYGVELRFGSFLSYPWLNQSTLINSNNFSSSGSLIGTGFEVGAESSRLLKFLTFGVSGGYTYRNITGTNQAKLNGILYFEQLLFTAYGKASFNSLYLALGATLGVGMKYKGFTSTQLQDTGEILTIPQNNILGSAMVGLGINFLEFGFVRFFSEARLSRGITPFSWETDDSNKLNDFNIIFGINFF